MDGGLTLFPETYDPATKLYSMTHIVSHSNALSNSRAAVTTPPLHCHRFQVELFAVKKGRMRFVCGGVEGVAHPGQVQTMLPCVFGRRSGPPAGLTAH